MTDHEVVIAGGGPTGLMLAAELALAGVDAVIVERRTSQHVDGSRAGGLYPRTIEVLDQRGVADRFLDAGYTVPALGFAGMSLDISDFPTRHNYVLALWQKDFEPILARWVDELGVPAMRGCEVVGFTQDAAGVDVAVAGGTSVRGRYLVGCDGGRSVVRKAAGIDFIGTDPSTSWLIAEVEMDEEPDLGMRNDRFGTHGLSRMGEAGPIRVLITERELRHGEPTMDELGTALVQIYGTDFGVSTAHWLSRFTDATRQASSYRNGRVLIAGDAAHIHPPHGGQGLNTGVQDAVNLGWKLAHVVKHVSPDELLDSYEAERHPVGARAIDNTKAMVALSRPDERHQALRELMTELLALDQPRRHIAGKLSGLDICYDLGTGHPLLGRRMPDIELPAGGGAARLFEVMHDGRAVLVDFRQRGDGLDLSPWAARVRLIAAQHQAALHLPVVGAVDTPPAVLIRPDGHVAWTGELADPELPRALSRWCGSDVVGSAEGVGGAPLAGDEVERDR